MHDKAVCLGTALPTLQASLASTEQSLMQTQPSPDTAPTKNSYAVLGKLIERSIGQSEKE
ncbi:hypothetical protein SAMN03159474_02171 [Pseudomonas sp. NFACC08-1]|nr:hypothetical protein SAMN03159474_02171 [Pseudomonas sp. NFACC08-1]SFL15858.1 hypothetical protein SAMN03159307_00938 [Pseudomonas sp. NFACC46-3]